MAKPAVFLSRLMVVSLRARCWLALAAGQAGSARTSAVLLGLLLASGVAGAQEPAAPATQPRPASATQTGDTSFALGIPRPAFPPGGGPVLLVDEAHFNFHTVAGRFAPFARLLRLDGFVVRSLRTTISRQVLDSAGILVIANALGQRNTNGNWSLPTPSAFSRTEIDVVQRWVADGGSLFLIADHMPFPGAAADLAAAFGVILSNGFAADSRANPDHLVFRRSDGSLGPHLITDGRDTAERIDSVRSFTGTALRVLGPHSPLMTLDPAGVVLLPSVAWAFDERTPRIPSAGLLQGVVLTHGSGRVAAFGEAAMFTAQVVGGEHPVAVGMNLPEAPQNAQFLLNVTHWLAGLLPAS